MQSRVVQAQAGPELLGMAQVAADGAGGDGELCKLFVDPAQMGRGVGAALFGWAVAELRRAGAARMRIEADPDAVPFYRHMGARLVGQAPSGSVPGRMLPLLSLPLG